MELEAPVFSTDIGWRGTYSQLVKRPASGAAPLAVRVKFWANGKVWFKIRGAGAGAVTDWKPATASETFGAGRWASYGKNKAVSVEFMLQPCEGSSNESAAPASEVHGDGDVGACVLEWKAGGWFSGLSVYHAVTPSPDYS